MAGKTKSVAGKEYGPSVFAYVGDPNDPSTWHLPIPDEAHVRDAMARFNQADIPSDKKAAVARKILRAAKKYGIDASGFEKEYVKEAAADLSFDEIEQQIWAQLKLRFGTDQYDYPNYCLVETFPTYIIARGQDGELYRIPYTFGDNDGDGDSDDVILGDPQEVDVAYVPVSQSARFVIEAAVEDDGYAWTVVILKEGFAGGTVNGGSSPHYFTNEALQQVAAAVSGARFGRRHPGPFDTEDDPARIAGYFSDGKIVGNTVQAKLHIFPGETEIRDKLMAAKEAGRLDLFGLSILAYFSFKSGNIQGTKALISEKLAKLVSVDFVCEPGAGGKFLNSLRVAASAANSIAEMADMQKRAIKTSQQTGSSNAGGKGATMKDKILKVLEALRKRNAGRADELTKKLNEAKEESYSEILVEVSEALAAEPVAAAAAAAGAGAVDGLTLVKQAQDALAEAKKLDAKNRIEAKLIESKLPQPAVALVREHLKDQIPDDAAIDAEIKRVREAFAAFSTTGRASAAGTRVGGVLDTQDKLVLAFEAMLGVKESVKKCRESGIRPFRGPREAYVHITGDADLFFGRNGKGGFTRVSEAVSTGTFPNILLDALNKKLIDDYAEYAVMGLDSLYRTENLADFKTQHRIRMGYLSDLATVAEAGPYTEMAAPTDEQITYAAAKKGNLVTISEETIRNDDLGKIASYPTRMARAARHTFYKFISNFFINNPNYGPDGVAWFNAAHNNLSANPISVDELVAREVALMTQTEKDSGNPLGFPLRWLMVPAHLAGEAYKINNSQFYNPGPGLQLANPFYQRFGVPDANGHSKGIIVNALLDASDANDWYYGTDAAYGPFLVVGFLDGIQEPQIFLADLPTQGTLFTNDQIQYKVKHVYGGAIEDFRTVGKNVVP